MEPIVFGILGILAGIFITRILDKLQRYLNRPTELEEVKHILDAIPKYLGSLHFLEYGECTVLEVDQEKRIINIHLAMRSYGGKTVAQKFPLPFDLVLNYDTWNRFVIDTTLKLHAKSTGQEKELKKYDL